MRRGGGGFFQERSNVFVVLSLVEKSMRANTDCVWLCGCVTLIVYWCGMTFELNTNTHSIHLQAFAHARTRNTNHMMLAEHYSTDNAICFIKAKQNQNGVRQSSINT